MPTDSTCTWHLSIQAIWEDCVGAVRERRETMRALNPRAIGRCSEISEFTATGRGLTNVER
jgi:hypothetical protein